MKPNTLTSFKWKLFLRVFLSLCIAAVLTVVLFLIVDSALQDGFISNTVTDSGRQAMYFYETNKPIILVAVFSLILLPVLYLAVGRTTRYIKLIIGSLDNLMLKDELIELPKDFKPVQDRLNAIKFEALRSEQAARDEEQRKNDLIVYLAHDLKTPLTSIIGYLTLLCETQDLSPSARAKYLGISLKKAQRMEELVNEFFDITRFSLHHVTLSLAPINLVRMLEQMVDEYNPLLRPKGLRCILDVPPSLTIEGDADKLARVFDNLLRNAINYSDRNTPIQIFVEQQGQEVMIYFRNHGTPIPEKDLQTIFEKFYRTDSSRSTQHGGAGLGLAIAKEIVEMHHGKIWAESNPEYTEFAIALPNNSK